MSFDQAFRCLKVRPDQMDELWAVGWRHFGTYFFRYQQSWYHEIECHVMPLRLDLTRFIISRSQKRILTRNQDLKVEIRPTSIDDEKEQLFYQHRERFKENVPESINNFLSHQPATIPCQNNEIAVFLGEKLIAVSFLDLGMTATSAVYAMFDPVESKRSLGIFTMLTAIRFSIARGCRYYYPGYAYREPSFYDYKKRFTGLEYLDWEQGWQPLK